MQNDTFFFPPPSSNSFPGNVSYKRKHQRPGGLSRRDLFPAVVDFCVIDGHPRGVQGETELSGVSLIRTLTPIHSWDNDPPVAKMFLPVSPTVRRGQSPAKFPEGFPGSLLARKSTHGDSVARRPFRLHGDNFFHYGSLFLVDGRSLSETRAMPTGT